MVKMPCRSLELFTQSYFLLSAQKHTSSAHFSSSKLKSRPPLIYNLTILYLIMIVVPLAELNSNQTVTSKQADLDDMIDPALQDAGDDLGYVLAGCVDAKVSEHAMYVAIDDLCAEDSPPTNLEISQMDFIKLFSGINITKNQMIVFPGEKKSSNLDQFIKYFGNSRDDPTPFLFKCSTIGCVYQNAIRVQLHNHETSCTVEKIDNVLSCAGVKKTFACYKSGCKSSFDAKFRLNAYVREVHANFQPQPCTTKGCDPTIIYLTKAKFRRHAKAAHSTYKPTACDVPRCSSKTLFPSHDGYEQHLRLVHKLSGEEKAKYNRLSSPAWTPRSCRVAGCRFSTTIHKRREHLRSHLEKQHELDKDSMDVYLY
jgi:hypothetical protein